MRRVAPRWLVAGFAVALVLSVAVGMGCSTFTADTTAVDLDAGDGGSLDASTPSVCDHVEASFCDDFEVLPLEGKWPLGTQAEGGTVTLVDGSVASPLYAARASLAGSLPSEIAAGTPRFAQLYRIQSRNIALPKVVFDADLRIDSLGKTKDGVVGIVNISFDKGESVLFVVSQGGDMLAGNVSAYGSPVDAGDPVLVTLPPVHTWFHFSIELDLAAGTIGFSVDGEQRVKDAVGVRSTAPEYELGVGAFAAAPEGVSDVVFDNVVITAR